jgi:acetylornithine deacetylase
MTDADLLALHRELVATRSVSGDEAALADRVEGWLAARLPRVLRYKHNVVAVLPSTRLGAGGDEGPLLAFCSHLDTVPPGPGWTADPWAVRTGDGRVVGLGANDAKASVAAMLAAFARLAEVGGVPGGRVLLALVAEEETGGDGAEVLVPWLEEQGLTPDAAVIGEPTDLALAIAQKGQIELELCTTGRACHAAHGRALQAPNALSLLARDLVALEALDWGPPDPWLGPVTVEPTLASGGSAVNVIPASASCRLDVRTNPAPDHAEVIARLRAAVKGDLRVLRADLDAAAIAPDHPLVVAALAARPASPVIGSRGMSDLVHFRGIPALKVGPGRTERSHTADEFVLESEVVEGACFYEALARAFFRA